MSDFITLSCPSCGAKLEITQDINRFACSHCGREHIVKRSGGIVSLSPVVDAINQVKSGVDKTAAELALARIPKEIASLATEKSNLLKTYPMGYSTARLIGPIVIGIILLIAAIASTMGQVTGQDGTVVLACLIPGFVFILFGLWPILKGDTKQIKARKLWQESTGRRINTLDEQIAIKQSELERNRKLVSQ